VERKTEVRLNVFFEKKGESWKGLRNWQRELLLLASAQIYERNPVELSNII